MDEICYEVAPPDSRAAQHALEKVPGVLSVEPSGATLHLFAARDVPVSALSEAAGAEVTEIVPSLEDIFIAVIRQQELPHAA